ncbi:hypothetical protein BOTBODRAFT_580733 [Botryobasidium botryosum FD-172 SS1]|uniref:Protein kinase domain-containing protein n=1 Tax=Botryobasidium botryosum (strain FD-172 SS1) TaxID=930990 RepID=A0A067N1N6_BOTB1|nr:hypothetical protein BOTBODRAFT_580733 [Botryobasidium botryosum FD-172 SS1]
MSTMSAPIATHHASVSTEELIHTAQYKAKEPTNNSKLSRCQKQLAFLEEVVTSIRPFLTDRELSRCCEFIEQLCKEYRDLAVAIETPISSIGEFFQRRATVDRLHTRWNINAVDARKQILAYKSITATRVRTPRTQSAPVTSTTSPTQPSPDTYQPFLGDLSELSTLLGAGAGENLHEQLSHLIARTRQSLATTPEPIRSAHLEWLLKLYAITGVYPCDDGLSSLEVVPDHSKREGNGAFGTCCRGVFLKVQQVVLKSLNSDEKEKVSKRLRREATLWGQLRHPRILRFIGLHTVDDTTYMVSPYMENGHATAYVAKQPNLNCLDLLTQVAEGLQYLHDMDVVHGDLRGSNILISASGDAFIADFGLSKLLVDFDPELYSTVWHTAGNYRWLAPELMPLVAPKPGAAYQWPLRTKESDVFSFGRVIVELTTACAPFAAEVSNHPDILSQVRTLKNPQRPVGEAAFVRGLDDDMWKLAQDCWSDDPASRPTAAEIFVRLQSVSRECASPASI